MPVWCPVGALLSLFVSPCQFRLQFPDPGSGLCLGFLGCIRPRPFPLEGGYLLPRLRVAPAELAALPPDEQAQHGAVTLQDSFIHFFDGNRLVPALRQPVSGQLGPVESPGLVEPPVLFYAQRGVPAGLSSTSFLPVLSEAISMTRSGGLPCRDMT